MGTGTVDTVVLAQNNRFVIDMFYFLLKLLLLSAVSAHSAAYENKLRFRDDFNILPTHALLVY